MDRYYFVRRKTIGQAKHSNNEWINISLINVLTVHKFDTCNTICILFLHFIHIIFIFFVLRLAAFLLDMDYLIFRINLNDCIVYRLCFQYLPHLFRFTMYITSNTNNTTTKKREHLTHFVRFSW